MALFRDPYKCCRSCRLGVSKKGNKIDVRSCERKVEKIRANVNRFEFLVEEGICSKVETNSWCPERK